MLAISSDDDEILDIGRRFATTIKRPAVLAGDKVPPYPAIIHALDALDEPFTHVCLLQPTSPFRTANDIDIAVSFCRNRVAVASFEDGAEVPNGAVYVGRTDWLRRGGNFDEPDVFPYYMPASRSIDIDTEEDWAKAEEML